jgi:HemY protein
MLRIVLFLAAIAVAAFGAAWIADQTGTVVLTWSGWRAEVSLPVFLLGVFLVVIAAMLIWAILSGLWRMPGHMRRGQHARRHARARHAITHGLIAIGTGDADAARKHSQVARRDAEHDPLALLLHAQTAQIEGDREGARRAFTAMAKRDDTRLLGLRGLFVEAQRADDLPAAVAIAEEALKVAPASPWAAHAVLGFRCASGDWNGALGILEGRYAAGRIDKVAYRRERGVLLTARALDLETSDRDQSRDSAMEAVKLAPTLVPAAVLAAKYLSEAHQIRRAMRILETAWLAQPHPDLADAYAHVRLGDSAQQRLMRAETLAAKTPGHIEGALAVARQAIAANAFDKARAALAPFVEAPTQRVALLMAEIERAEHGDDARARTWMLKALRAAHDPVWTADGYVSDRWRPVSPVTGRLDAFQWQTPLAALPSDKPIEAQPSGDALIPPPAQPVPAIVDETGPAGVLPAPAAGSPAPADESIATPPPAPVLSAPPEVVSKDAAAAVTHDVEAEEIATQDNEPPPAAPAPVREPAPPPLFRPQAAVKPAAVPPVIPIVRAPDDPGVDEPEAVALDEFDATEEPPAAQRGGWRGFLSRWGA